MCGGFGRGCLDAFEPGKSSEQTVLPVQAGPSSVLTSVCSKPGAGASAGCWLCPEWLAGPRESSLKCQEAGDPDDLIVREGEGVTHFCDLCWDEVNPMEVKKGAGLSLPRGTL